MAYEISPEAIIALAVLNSQPGQLEITDVSELFFQLRQKRLDEVQRVALRRLPEGGFYSDDVEAFFGRLLEVEYATARSPLSVQPKGVELCKEILNDELAAHPEAMKKVASALGFGSIVA